METDVNRVIACPKCQKKYQVQGDPTGKSMKCAQCQSVFTVGKPAATGNQPASAPTASQDELRRRQAEQAAIGVAGPLTSQPGLFPDQTVAPGIDPLGNHVVQDPGFANVSVDEIRKKRESEERRKKKYQPDDPLAKFNREQREKRAEEAAQKKQTKTGIKIGIGGAIFYVIALIIGAVIAMNYETGFYILLGLWIFAAILEFMVDLMLTQYVKELDPEQYLYYALIPPYRVYYWIVHWKDLMGFVIVEMVIGIPLIINAVLVWYFDDKWSMGWFDF